MTDAGGAHPLLGLSGPRDLSPPQRPLLASQRRFPSSPLQNTSLVTVFEASVDADRLVAAFSSVVDASDALRTVITADDRVDFHPVGEHAGTEIVDLCDETVDEWSRRRVRTPVDVRRSVFDSVVLRRDGEVEAWYLSLHHVATDATSSALVTEAVAAAYAGEAPALPTYYPRWDAEPSGRRHERAVEHWANRQPADRIGRLYRQTDGTRPESGRVFLPLDADRRARLDAAIEGPYRMLSADLAWSTLLLAVAGVHIARVSGATNIVLGLPVHNRTDVDARAIVGPMMEVFPVDLSIDLDATFAEVRATVARSVMETLRHAQTGSLPSGVEVEAVVNVISRARFTDFAGIPVRTDWVFAGATDPAHLFQLQLTPYGEHGELLCDVSLAAAPEAGPALVGDHVDAILRAAIDDPDVVVGDIDLLDTDEHDIVQRWGRGADRNAADPIVARVANALAGHSDVVVEDGPVTITGDELDLRIGRVARWLRERGVGSGDRPERVALDLPRGLDAIVAMQAVLRAGGSFVPLDPEQPEIRRARLVERAGCHLRLEALPDDDELPTEPLDVVVPDPASEAYLLFTSGSTGEPKGVPITHRGLTDYIEFAQSAYVSPGQVPVAPLFSALTFDLTITTLFVPLVLGGKIVVIHEGGGAGLATVAARDDLTWMKATPSHLELLLRLGMDSPIRSLVVGGEAFRGDVARRLFDALPGVRIFNEYGPTEAVVGCMIHEATPDGLGDAADVPIGIPAPGVDLRIVDSRLRPVPLGASGELLISHDGLTAGYLDAEHDRGRFVEYEGERFYRSGDLVRLVDPDTAVYQGRIDEQIKLGGIRLEPVEIEHALSQHPSIERAAARLWPTDGASANPVLCAWVEPAESAAMPSPAHLRAFLAERIPRYAMPSAFVEVERIPMTTNGKVDTRRLPAPTRADRVSSGDDGGPVNELEQAIIDLYEEILDLDGVGVGDDFFDLGGDSLAALRLASRLIEQTGRAVREEQVFALTTPRTLAAEVEETAGVLDGPSPRPIDEPPTIAEAEHGLLFEFHNAPDDPKYNVGAAFTLGPGVDPQRLIDALRTVVAAHVPLSWTYTEPRVQLSVDDALEVIVRSAAVDEDEFHEIARRVQARPFDPETGPLGRCVVQPLVGGGLGVLTNFHHVSIDAYSLERLWRQVERVYTGEGLPDLTVDYSDWSHWQIGRLADDATTPWLDEFVPGAPIDFGEGGGTSGYRTRAASFDLRTLRTGPGATPAANVLAGLALTLSPRAAGEHLTVDVLMSSREHSSADELIGYFLNPLPIAIDAARGATGAAIAEQASAGLRSLVANRAVPRGRIVADRRALGLPELRTSPMFVYVDWQAGSLGSIDARHEILSAGSAVTDASFFAMVDGNSITLGLEHDGAVLSADEADRILEALDANIAAVIERPHDELCEGPGHDLGDAIVDGPWLDLPPVALHELIRDQARRNPARVAVAHGDDAITYAELDERAAALAVRLVEAGARSGERVAVSLPRSIDQIVALQAVLMAGAAYVPLDPSYPLDRQALILDDAEPVAVITDEPVAAHAARGLRVVSPHPTLGEAIDLDRLPRVDPDTPAYIIHTSGSTGRPKGVVVRHRNIVATTRARQQVEPAPVEAFLLLSSFAFDSSMVGIFGTLTSGGRLVLPLDDERDDLGALTELIARQRISHLLALPSLYRAVLTESTPGSLDHLRVAMVAGEPCPVELVAQHTEHTDAALVNEYGPTETAVWSHSVDLVTADLENGVPIGLPGPGVRHVVVDSSLTPVSAGTVGELLIGGAGVAEGYLGRDDLTRERFLRLPFDADGGRWYRTGDLVRQADDGSLVFAGRADNQLKVRGFRIEPEEVEELLRSIDGVVDAAVDGREIGRRTQLVAWVVGSVSAGAIRDQLSERVPDHLVPSTIVRLDALPLGVNGKVDRAALSVGGDTPVAAASSDAAPSVSSTESAMLEIWGAVLGTTVGLDDEFLDLGGDSILSLQITTRARRAGFELTPRDVLVAKTVRRLVVGLDSPQTTTTEIVSTPVAAGRGVTPAQQWFFDQGFAAPNEWNQTLTVGLEPGVDREVLVAALDDVRRAHVALRSRFDVAPAPTVVEMDEPAALVTGADLDAVVAEIDFGTGRTAGLVVTDDQVVLTLHHLVIDVVSWDLLLQDWRRAYAARLAGDPVVLERSDPRAWADEAAAHAEDSALIAAWSDVADDGLRWADPVPDRSSVRHVLDPDTTAALVASQRAAGGSVRDSLAGVLAHVVGMRQGVDRIGVTLEGHGREPFATGIADVSGTVGWFTCLYPLTVSVAPTGPRDTVAAATIAASEIPDGGVGEGIVRRLGDHVRPPLPMLAVNYLGDLDRAVPPAAPFTAPLTIDGTFGAANHPTHAIGIQAQIVDGRLELELDAPTADVDDPAALLDEIVAALHATLDDTPTSWPLTPVQAGLLFECLADPTPTLYLEQVRAPLTGDVDLGRLRAAWEQVVARHAVLRSHVDHSSAGVPMQVVDADYRLPWTIVDLAEGAVPDRLAADDRAQGVPVDGPLQRVTVLRSPDGASEVLWTFHHLLLDGWSAALVLDEVLAHLADEPGLAPAPQFDRFVAWRAADAGRRGLDHWRQLLDGFEEPTQLALDRGPQSRAGEAHRVSSSLTAADSEALFATARRHGVTLNSLFQAAWSIVLGRHADRDDVVFGVVTSGRPAELDGADATAGMFLNTLPFRSRLAGETPLGEMLGGVFEQGLDLVEHQSASLVEITAALDATGSGLFDTALIFENYPRPAARETSMGFGPRRVFEQTPYAFTLMVGVVDDTAVLNALVDPARLTDDEAALLLDDVARVLREFGDHDGALGRLPYMTEAGPALEGPTLEPLTWATAIPAWIDEVAARRAAAPAVVSTHGSLSHAELLVASRELADDLRTIGVGPGQAIGIAMPRRSEAIAAMVAVMRTGAAYVLIEPGTPPGRLAQMIDGAGIPLVLTDDPARVGEHAGTAIATTDGLARVELPPAARAIPADTAFVTFTSGSTGTPKAVPISHEGLRHRLSWQLANEPLEAGEAIIAKTGWGFVDHLFEIWGALCGGGTVVLADEDDLGSLGRLLDLVATHEPRRLLLVPSLLDALLEADRGRGTLGSLDRITVSGEPIRADIVERVRDRHPDITLQNFYGMSEATGDVTWSALPPGVAGDLPIGRPIANHRALVVDQAGRPVRTGMPGELWVSGPGLSPGYLDGATERFVERDGRRWYRTGDIVVRQLDDQLRYLGRADSMVKLNGVRIELGEVETALTELDGVLEAVVVAMPPTQATHLVAHIVAHDTVDADLRHLLVDRLPAAFVPRHLVVHEELPRTATGKIDRRTLSAHRVVATGGAAVSDDPVVAMIADVMASALEVDHLGPDDDFFDHGGHSLLALRVAAVVEQATGEHLPLAQILIEPTPRRLAAAIQDGGTVAELLVPIASGERTFFVVHGAGGNVLNLRPLADELSPEVGVVGIQAVGAGGQEEPLRSVDAMAERYLAEIRTHQPAGPYLLGGFSGGGVIAFEMARRLREHGDEVELVLFDTYAPTASIQNVTASMHLRNLLDDGPRYLRERIDNRRTRRRRGSADPVVLGDEALDVAMTQAMIDAVGAYTAAPLEAPALLLSAIIENSAYRHNGEDRGWGDLLPALTVERVDGDHETIMHVGNVEMVADVVNAWLGR